MHILGIDIGGSGIKGAPVDVTRGVLTAERVRVPTPQPSTPDAVAATIREISQHFAWTGQIGCGLPAVVQNGVARTAANIDSRWIGTDAQRLLTQITGCPVAVINDADAAGIAEMRFGASRERAGTVLMVTIGTGLGTALFRDGALVPNTELGHIQLNGKEAEKYASAAVREKLGLTYKKWAKRFDSYLHLLQALFWPDLFIIGGGISKRHEKFLPYLTVDTEVLPATLRNEAGIVGAAAAVQQ
ncbi:MAG: polyphosphate--glucose phosphotransferase [Desulfuromonadales bacterium]